ncbi:MAG: 2'-5' RNA ligase family protein [Dyadobacter sp.]|uniref:2'-5' RNA ligase family protein n=1 Tax=Dyadobacter sp. TaxID=1914288 RepID=UPI003265898C
MNQYSLAIMPSQEIAQQVVDMKQLLKASIGKSYGSANAEAHVSLDGFEAEEENYPAILAEYQRIVAGLAPFEIVFSDFGDFDHANFSAFYIKPTDQSCDAIRERTGAVMKTFDKKLKKQFIRKWADESKNPHMSIGRRLTREWIAMAYSIFNTYEANFTCDSFVIRKFVEKKRQYEVIDILPLLGDDAATLQLDLFQP